MKLQVDNSFWEIDTPITGRDLLELVGRPYPEFVLNGRLPSAARERISLDQPIPRGKYTRFETVRVQAQQG